MRDHLQNRKRRAVEGETKDKLMQAMIDRFPFPVPESLVQEQVDARLERGLRALAAQGMTTEAMRKLDFERLRAAQRDSAVAEVKSGFTAGADCARRKHRSFRRGRGSRDPDGGAAKPGTFGDITRPFDSGWRTG